MAFKVVCYKQLYFDIAEAEAGSEPGIFWFSFNLPHKQRLRPLGYCACYDCFQQKGFQGLSAAELGSRFCIIKILIMKKGPRSLDCKLSTSLLQKGSGCSTTVAHMPHDLEVVGSKITRCCDFSTLLFPLSLSPSRLLKVVQHCLI